jgi:hypothetical protein
MAQKTDRLVILDLDDFFAFVVSALPAHAVGQDLATAILAVHQGRALQRMVAAAEALHPLGRSCLWDGHDIAPAKSVSRSALYH